MTAPLMLGNDLRNMKNETKEIILNKVAIEINQDPLEQGRRITKNGTTEIWMKHLSTGPVAVLLLNRDKKKELTITLPAKSLGIKEKFSVYDIYQKSLGTFHNAFSSKIKPRSGLFIKVEKVNF